MRSRFRTARLASMVESGISWECHLRGALLLVRSLLISGATFGENSINAAFGFAPAAGFVVIVDSGWQGDGCASRVFRGPPPFRSLRAQNKRSTLLDNLGNPRRILGTSGGPRCTGTTFCGRSCFALASWQGGPHTRR